MSKYSPVIIFYIILQSISLLLLSILIFLLLRSKPHFAKWTLFQLFISAFGNGFAALPPIIMYGDDLINRAFETPICIIANKIANNSLYPLESFSLVIAFYLWHVLVTHRLDIEKKCFWYISGVIWIYSIVFNIFEMLKSSKQEHWGVNVSILNCKSNQLSVGFYGYIIPSCLITVLTLLITCHSSIMLYKRWKVFKCNMNRTTAIRLGHAVRLHTCCVMIIVMLSLTLIPRIVDNNKSINSPIITSTSFIAASVGTVIFLIFGTNTKAAIFLPFCYYVPPDSPRIQEPACNV
ncbi:hypothetical protein C1645_774536 [Glomus cerebriforme]|uniref:G-protein coupled receptors family 1 profile domain-containing protein n=1 Tax=Glomus cerebriforme TaxID=658196 RepID=A0A397SXS3_9GLOM|nr:hypothetical protein C1645_774536 [Glomus cerebriforme]